MGARLGSGHPLHLQPHHSWMSPLVWLLEEQNKPRTGHDADFGAQVPHGHLLSMGGCRWAQTSLCPTPGVPGSIGSQPGRANLTSLPPARTAEPQARLAQPIAPGAPGQREAACAHPGSLAVDQRRSLPSPSTGAGAPDWIFVLPPAGSGPVGSYRVHRCQAAPLPSAPLARSALAALNDFVPVNCSSLL